MSLQIRTADNQVKISNPCRNQKPTLAKHMPTTAVSELVNCNHCGKSFKKRGLKMHLRKCQPSTKGATAPLVERLLNQGEEEAMKACERKARRDEFVKKQAFLEKLGAEFKANQELECEKKISMREVAIHVAAEHEKDNEEYDLFLERWRTCASNELDAWFEADDWAAAYKAFVEEKRFKEEIQLSWEDEELEDWLDSNETECWELAKAEKEVDWQLAKAEKEVEEAELVRHEAECWELVEAELARDRAMRETWDEEASRRHLQELSDAYEMGDRLNLVLQVELNSSNSNNKRLRDEAEEAAEYIKSTKMRLVIQEEKYLQLEKVQKAANAKLSFLECMNCGEMVGQKAARCPSGHPLCSTCLDEELVAAVANKTEKPVGCSMCSTQDLHVPIHTNEIAQTAGGEIFARYVGMLAESRAMKQVQQELLIVPKTGAVSLELRTPCCGTVFGGFQGCCALNCFECPGKMFCAFCFEVFEKGAPGEEDPCHRHLQDCNLNTSHVEYFADDESQKNNVWLCFDAQRARQANGGERFPKPMEV